MVYVIAKLYEHAIINMLNFIVCLGLDGAVVSNISIAMGLSLEVLSSSP